MYGAAVENAVSMSSAAGVKQKHEKQSRCVNKGEQMTVKELVERLSEMPQDAPVYAEGEAADKVIFEKSPDGDYGIVRIFKAWDVEFTGSWDVVGRVLEKRFGEEFAHAAEMAKNLNVDI